MEEFYASGEYQTCECGCHIKSHVKFGFVSSLRVHKETEKHKLMMDLLNADPESHALALDPKTDTIKCECGQSVRRWFINRHRESTGHKEIMAKRERRLHRKGRMGDYSLANP